MGYEKRNVTAAGCRRGFRFALKDVTFLTSSSSQLLVVVNFGLKNIDVWVARPRTSKLKILLCNFLSVCVPSIQQADQILPVPIF